jgi:asparagine synthetase B (glutamine-hydrolysing)
MPGLYGIAGNENSQKAFDKMSKILNHHDYRLDSYSTKNISVGRQHLGTLFPLTQPVWDKSRSCCLMADGYIIIEESIADSQINSAQTLGKLVEWYREEGDSFINHIKTGMFNIVIIDLRETKVKIINDRLGLLPIYYGFDKQGGLVFAPEEKTLIRTKIVDDELDWTGISEFLYFLHPIGTRTFYRNVKLLPAASILEFDLDSKKLQSRQYYHVTYNTDDRLTLKQCAELAYEKFKISCRRLNLDPFKYALMLSGGLDSRLILSAWENRENLTAYTYGSRLNDDTKLASQLAGAANVKHKISLFTEADFFDSYEEALYKMESISHGMLTKLFYDIHVDDNSFVLDGFLGDVLFGGLYFFSLHPLKKTLYSSSACKNITSSIEVGQRLRKDISFGNPSLVISLLSENVKTLIAEHESEIDNDILGGIEAHYDEYQYMEQVYETFKLINRGRRRINPQGLRARFWSEIVYPFYDYDLMDFVFTIPLTYRIRDKLIYAIYRHVGGELSKIRRANYILAPAAFNFKIQVLCSFLYALGRRITRKTDEPYYDAWYRNGGDFLNFVDELLKASDSVVSGKLLAAVKNKQLSLRDIIPLFSFVLWRKMFTN